MKHRSIPCAAAVLLFTALVAVSISGTGCAPSAETARTSAALLKHTSAVEALDEALAPLLSDTLFPPATVGIQVSHVGSGVPLYSLNAHALRTPGSTMKVVTAYGALATLGPGFRFATGARVDTQAGTITVRGSGDPLFSLRDMDTLAAAIAAATPPLPRWTLLGDTGAFTGAPWGKGWMWDDEPDPTAPFVSPLSVEGNCVRVTVRPGSSPRPVVSVDPPQGGHSILNLARTAAAADSADPLRVTRSAGDGGSIVVRGTMAATDPPVTVRLSVREPARMFLELLADRLTAAGVRTDSLGWSALPAGTALQIQTRLRGLDSVLVFMNTWSDNLAAECLLRTIGEGSPEEGVRRIRAALGARGVDTAGIMQGDGSGVSRYNLLSPASLVGTLLAAARDTSAGPLFAASLPAAGGSGTLASRMKGTAAEGNVRAKTGTLTGVTALAGYVTTADGELLAFAVLAEGIPGPVRPYRAFQDSLCATLARMHIRPHLP